MDLGGDNLLDQRINHADALCNRYRLHKEKDNITSLWKGNILLWTTKSLNNLCQPSRMSKKKKCFLKVIVSLMWNQSYVMPRK